MRRALVINARLFALAARVNCSTVPIKPAQHTLTNTITSTLCYLSSVPNTQESIPIPPGNWTFTKIHSLNGDGERSYNYKHLHHQLANIHTRAKISLASEAPAAHLVRLVTTTRRETRRTSRSTSRRHSQPPASAARRESKPALLPPRNYPQSIQPQDVN